MVCTGWFCNIVSSDFSHFSGGDPVDILVFGFLFVSAALIFLTYAYWVRFSVRKERKSYGLPEGLILYSDLNIPAKPLFSNRFQLVGKPDFIIKKHNHYIPVEVKSGGGRYPHQSQVFQLAAYCQILEDASGIFVPEGVLLYNNVPFSIAFNPKLRFELESVMKTMRASLRSGTVKRNHNDPMRCRHCSIKRYCTDVVRESG